MQRKQRKEKTAKLALARSWRIGIAVSRFNSDVTKRLLGGALRELAAAGVRRERIDIAEAPGSFELPLVCQKLARRETYAGLIALGCVIKGETDHYYFVAGSAARGIMNVMLAHDLPIGFGVITVDTLKQARRRSSDPHNKGSEAARALLHMLAP